MRPVFCGNFEYDARPSELEKLFKRYGRVDRVDMKSGFAFIYMEDERDAEDAIRGLDRIEFGRKGRRLRVEWTKQERGVRKPPVSRKSTNMRPSKTLFVINFDPHHTRTRDLERHFDPYGKIVNVRIRRNFAFVQYDSEDDATRALDATNMSKLLDRVISVEFSEKDNDERRNGYSPDRGRDRRRSRSPYRRERGSPDYGRGSSPSRRERGSPDSGYHRSPNPYRRERRSPDYGHKRSKSPHPRERGERGSPNYGRRNRSPRPTERSASENLHGRSPSPFEREAVRGDHGNKYGDHSPKRQEKAIHEDGVISARSPYDGERSSPENGELTMDGSPYARENGYGVSPGSLPEQRTSPNFSSPDSPMEERYNSRSPPADE